ncbi:MAG: hypothetical protein ACFE8L_01045 [Candidatus Hodarchaeota archaeon]
MICDIVIIRDGLPLLSKSFNESSSSQTLFTQGDNLIMASGFFSALNSFSDSFEDLGNISELKLGNNNLKVSFLRDPSIPNLIFLATYDENSKGLTVQGVLKKISKTFLQQYNHNQILEWSGRKDTFKSFEQEIMIYINEEQDEIKPKSNQNVNDVLSSLGIKIEDTANSVIARVDEIEEKNVSSPEYYAYIPRFTISKKINPKFYLTGETSHKIFYQIDGRKSIELIAKDLNIEPEKVYNISKNLIKLGFISLF